MLTSAIAIVPAAGSGARFGGDIPKQYQLLRGEAMLVVTLKRLLSSPAIDSAIVALAADDRRWPGLRELNGKPIRTVIGGATRTESVGAGVAALAAEADGERLVAVHDAARPLVSVDDLARVVRCAATHPVGAILGRRVSDTLKRVDESSVVLETIPRENVWSAETPQVLRLKHLRRAYSIRSHAATGSLSALPDDANALEVIGLTVCICEAVFPNLKLTMRSDRAFAEWWLTHEAEQLGNHSAVRVSPNSARQRNHQETGREP